jgi:CubicO group peptidase (beta-lactamase class C family)
MAAGLLLGGLVQAADGRRIDRFFAEEIAGPLGAEYAFGLDDAQIARTARIVPNDASVTWSAWKNPATNLGRAWHMMPHPREEFFNSHAFRAGLFPSANGHGNPRAVARIYAALANDGTLDGVTIVSPAAVARMRDVQWDEICGMTERPFRYGLGQFVNKPPLFSIGPNPAAFGHPGVGGAIGFADPENGIAFSYAPNFLCEGAGQGDRVPALIEAVYKA